MIIKPIQNPYFKNLLLGNMFLILSNYFFDRDFYYIYSYTLGTVALWLGVVGEKLSINSEKIIHTPGLGDDILSLVGLTTVTNIVSIEDIQTITLVKNRNGRCVQLKDSRDQNIRINVHEYPIEKIHELISQIKKTNSSVIVSPEISHLNQDGLTKNEQTIKNIIFYVFIGINIFVLVTNIFTWFKSR